MKYLLALILTTLMLRVSYAQEEPFWEFVEPPSIGDATALAIDSRDNLYIGSFSGLFISRDHAENWEKIFDVEILENKIAINSRDEIILCNKRENVDFEINFSDDYGETWFEWKNDLDIYITRVKEAKFIDNRLYLLWDDNSQRKIYYSDKFNSDWKTIEITYQLRNTFSFDFYSDSVFAICGQDMDFQFLVLLTTDRGNTWNRVDIPGLGRSVKFVSRDSIYLCTNVGLYLLEDDKEVKFIGPNHIGVYDVTFGNNNEIYLANSDLIYISYDGGKTWEKKAKGLEHIDKIPFWRSRSILDIVNDSKGNLFCRTYDWGIYKSTNNGESWQESNNGFFSADIYDIAFDKDKNIYLATNGLYKSSDNGKSWKIVEGFEGEYTGTVFVNSKNYIFASSGVDDGLFRSKDGGETWEFIENSPFAYSMVENSKGDLFATHEFGTLNFSSDDGDTWEIICDGLDCSSGGNIAINSEDHVFTEDAWGELYRSTDNGKNWEEMLNLDDISGYFCYGDVEILFFKNDYGYASYVGCLFKTTDNGRTWHKVDDMLDTLAYPYAIDSLQQLYWTGPLPKWLDYFMTLTTPDGEIIDTFGESSGIPDYLVNLTVNPDGYIWGVLVYEGLYRSRKNYVSVDENAAIQNNIILEQNSPNPFSNETTIKYSLLEPGFVKITIFDLLGNKIAQIENSFKSAGEQTITYKNKNLKSGTYFYRLESGGHVETKIMQVVR